jgi:transcriptional regulator with GAF, ATPase, and Fis domain
MRKRIDHIPQHILDAFASYSWPGNVRELQNLIERAVIRSDNGVLPNPLAVTDKNPLRVTPSQGTFTVSPSQETFRDSTRTLILHALDATGWVIGGTSGAAARLGLKRTTLITKMKKLGIYRPVLQKHTDGTEKQEGEDVQTGSESLPADYRY